jgi:hypothetical protein
MGKYLYAFAAKDIQSYILIGGKLKEMVGGSELVNSLCTDYLLDSLDTLGIKTADYIVMTQAAGWARIIFNKETDARVFYKNWPFLADMFAPGLHIVQAMKEVNGLFSDTISEIEDILRYERNKVQTPLPEIGPLIDRNPRTGLAGVTKDHENSIFDKQSKRKKDFKDNKRLIEKIKGGSVKERWPDEMTLIAGSERNYLAVIHADGNSLGRILIKLDNHLVNNPHSDAAKIFQGFSSAIEDATVAATRTACDRVLLPDCRASKDKIMAARPIVLGGDDLTIIVRADLAFNFTETFLESFEMESQQSIEKHLKVFKISGLPEKLTACAGVAFIKQAYPFSRAYELSESLCRHAKDSAKKIQLEKKTDYVPSSFSFHRISTSIAGDYESITQKELTSKDGFIKMSFGPYSVGMHTDGVTLFKDLTSLSKTLQKIPSGSIRELITTLYADKTIAASDFKRILQVLQEKGNGERTAKLKEQMEKLTGNATELLWNSKGQSPLLDAHRLAELCKKGGMV